MPYTRGKQPNHRERPQQIVVAAFVCFALVVAAVCAAWATFNMNQSSTWENVSAGQSALAGRAFADNNGETVDSNFEVDGVTYSVTEVANPTATGSANKVALKKVNTTKQGSFAIPSTVTSPNSGATYDVAALYFDAFESCKGLTEVTIPASVTDFTLPNSVTTSTCFNECSALASVKVADDSPCFTVVDGALYAKGTSGLPVALLCVPVASDISALEIPATVSTVVPYAATNAQSLVSVHFSGSLTGDANAFATAGLRMKVYAGGIGERAFSGCTSLTSVTFDEGVKLGVAASSSALAIGNYAFSGCVSLNAITIPAIESATRKADAYRTFEENNPGSNQTIGISATFKSGFDPYWHNVSGPVARVGIGDSAFSNCENLASVSFATGTANGAFAYFAGTSSYFSGCNSLKALIFEGKQSYFGDPSHSMMNGAFSNVWNDTDGNQVLAEIPTRYYAVDYYATQADAEAADVNGSSRLARVEYAAGTSVSDIATGAESLADQVADASAYALTEADGQIPSATEVALAAGLGEGDWVWKLTGSQSRRAGLTESCKAYLTKRNDISAGRFSSDVQTALYLACDRNLSESQQVDCAFDAARYASGSSYQIAALSGEVNPWYNYDITVGGFLTTFDVCASDGTVLSEGTDYTVSYKTYDSATGQLVDATLDQGTGAYLVCITPTEQSGYTGQLQEWIVIKTHAGTVVSGISDTVSGTVDAARHVYGQTSWLDFTDRRYSVTIGANDAVGALVGAGFAGLVCGAINVEESDSSSYGFMVNPNSDNTGRPTSTTSSRTFSRTTSDGEMDAATYSVKAFTQFEKNRTSLGVSADDYPWGDTAVLIPRWYEQYYAAAANWAYAMKAPVFFTSDDGTVSADTASCLAKFKNVVVMGSEGVFSADVYNALETTLGSSVKLSRMQGEGDSVASFSLVLANDLIARGLANTARVAVVDPYTPADVAAAVTYTGHEGGILLTTLSTADSKTIANYLHSKSGSVATVFVAGRQGCAAVLESSEWTADASAFGAIWEIDSIFDKVMESVTSNVDEYPNIHIGPVEVDPQPNDAPSDDGGNNDPGNDPGNDPTPVFENYGGSTTYLTGTQGAASTSAKAVAAAVEKAVAQKAAALTDAADTNTGDTNNSDENESNALVDTLTRAPLTTTVPFLASLSALCAIAAPVLRRCK